MAPKQKAELVQPTRQFWTYVDKEGKQTLDLLDSKAAVQWKATGSGGRIIRVLECPCGKLVAVPPDQIGVRVDPGSRVLGRTSGQERDLVD